MTIRPLPASRREFLRQAGALSALLGSAAPLGMNLLAASSAAAQSAGDFKALVCVFLVGGNDAFNTVLPTDAPSWAAYSAARNQMPDSIALLRPGLLPQAAAAAGSPARLGGVLPIQPLNAQGRSFALHPLLGPLQTLFDSSRRLAIVPNIGPLVMPTSKAQFDQPTHPRPARLYSHNDQQNTWQALAPEGASAGWGGRLADLLASGNTNPVFTAVSASGNAVWLSGRTVRQYQVGNSGAVRLGLDAQSKLFGSAELGATLQRIVSTSRGSHLFEADLASLAKRSIDAELLLSSALRPASDTAFGTTPAGAAYNPNTDPKLQYDNPLTGMKSANALALQLQIVARMVDAGLRGASGTRRQVFFVSLGGFDTHDMQNRSHADLMGKVAHALSYFDGALGAIGARDSVTTFTASDFGRTFTSNGDGTDHGWGGHQFVMGGAVKGGDLYGNFPALGLKNASNNNFDSSPDQLGNGALLPQTSVDQLGATLGRWLGASDQDLLDVFPNLKNFDPARRNLGFMAA